MSSPHLAAASISPIWLVILLPSIVDTITAIGLPVTSTGKAERCFEWQLRVLDLEEKKKKRDECCKGRLES